jgi:hypothetical protein
LLVGDGCSRPQLLTCIFIEPLHVEFIVAKDTQVGISASKILESHFVPKHEHTNHVFACLKYGVPRQDKVHEPFQISISLEVLFLTSLLVDNLDFKLAWLEGILIFAILAELVTHLVDCPAKEFLAKVEILVDFEFKERSWLPFNLV